MIKKSSTTLDLLAVLAIVGVAGTMFAGCGSRPVDPPPVSAATVAVAAPQQHDADIQKRRQQALIVQACVRLLTDKSHKVEITDSSATAHERAVEILKRLKKNKEEEFGSLDDATMKRLLTVGRRLNAGDMTGLDPHDMFNDFWRIYKISAPSQRVKLREYAKSKGYNDFGELPDDEFFSSMATEHAALGDELLASQTQSVELLTKQNAVLKELKKLADTLTDSGDKKDKTP
jgi:hypothetical protein